MPENKSIVITYVLSLIGGLFGLHHLYLGRTQHALLWFTTLGGFGVGLIYEIFFLLTKYVHEKNEDHSILFEYKVQMIQKKSPAFEMTRVCGQYLIALFYGVLIFYAFPDTWHKQSVQTVFVAICTVIGIAAGTIIVATIGPRRCSFIWPLLGAVVGMPFLIWHADSSPSFNISAFLSSLICEWKIEWDSDYFQAINIVQSADLKTSIVVKQATGKKRSFIQRCLFFGIGALLFTSVFTGAIYQNLQVDIKGQNVKVKDVLVNFFKSQEFVHIYQQLSNVVKELWNFYLQYGLKGIWTEIWTALDMESEKQAYETLNLSVGASQRSIETQCRALSRKWHPDRYHDSTQKQKAEATFMNIQQACDRLSDERQRRQYINTQR